MLADFLIQEKTFSFIACFLQFHFFIALISTDYMLTVMTHDCYMAILVNFVLL
jgi:olfactory receptor